jgi:DNA-binding FadR family transcriptional regulator
MTPLSLQKKLLQIISKEIWVSICKQIKLNPESNPSHEIFGLEANNWDGITKKVRSQLQGIVQDAINQDKVVEIAKIRIVFESAAAYVIHCTIRNDELRINEFRETLGESLRDMSGVIKEIAATDCTEELALKLWDLDGDFHMKLLGQAETFHLQEIVQIVLDNFKNMGMAKKAAHCHETQVEHEEIIKAITDSRPKEALRVIVNAIQTHVFNGLMRWGVLLKSKQKTHATGVKVKRLPSISKLQQDVEVDEAIMEDNFLLEAESKLQNVLYARLEKEIRLKKINPRTHAFCWILITNNENLEARSYPGYLDGHTLAIEEIKRRKLADDKFILVFYDPSDPFFKFD